MQAVIKLSLSYKSAWTSALGFLTVTLSEKRFTQRTTGIICNQPAQSVQAMCPTQRPYCEQLR